MKMNTEQNKGIFNGVFLGYFVLLLHVLLIVGLGFAVIVIKGIYDFRWLIFTVGILLIGVSGYIFYRRVKESNRSLREAMNDPALRGRTLEISLFGGMASVKLGHTNEQPQLIDSGPVDEVRQLEAPRTHVQELSELAKMLEDNLITREEFEQLKKEIVT